MPLFLGTVAIGGEKAGRRRGGRDKGKRVCYAAVFNATGAMPYCPVGLPSSFDSRFHIAVPFR